MYHTKKVYDTKDLTTAYLGSHGSSATVPLYGLTHDNIKPLYVMMQPHEVEFERHWVIKNTLDAVKEL